jgi:hypothetical protein
LDGLLKKESKTCVLIPGDGRAIIQMDTKNKNDEKHAQRASNQL